MIHLLMNPTLPPPTLLPLPPTPTCFLSDFHSIHLCREFSNGYLVAVTLSHFFPQWVSVHTYDNRATRFVVLHRKVGCKYSWCDERARNNEG